MKAQLKAGAEVEFVTPGELAELLERYLSGFLRPPQTVRPPAGIPLNASGNTCRDQTGQAGTAAAVAVPVFEVPAGYSLRLHRLGFFPDGFTFGVPYTSSTGYLEIHRRGVEDGIPLTAPGLPQIWSAGTADGIFYTNGERVSVLISGGPASVGVAVKLQGTLKPHVTE